MSKKNTAWGIEVGANALKAIRLDRIGDGMKLTDRDLIPFKEILSTPDVDVDEAIQRNLDKFLSRHDVSRSTVVVSVPGHAAFSRFAKLPPVDPKKIPEIVKFEAQQQIPFPMEQVEWDYQVFMHEDSPDVEVGIFAITKDRILEILSNYREAGLTVDAVTLSPLAMYNALAYDLDLDSDSPGTIMLDISTTSTDLVIIENGMIWMRTMAIGGNNFTEALIKAFKLTYPKAEKFKKEARTSKYARQIFQAMRPVFADLVQEVQKSLGYYQSLNRDANLTQLYGVGSTFRLPGLQKFLKQQLQVDVHRLEGFKKISVEGKEASEFAHDSLNYATAYGLALQGLGQERISANILPAHIVKQKMWKAKQPWLLAAAMIMLAVSLGAAGLLFKAQSNFRSQQRITDQKVQQVIHQASQFESEWSEIEATSDPRKQIENLRRVLDYRSVWPMLMEDLSRAAAALDPQPATLDANYDLIRQIPRGDRRRVYIDAIEAKYIVQAIKKKSDGSDEPATAAIDINSIWGENVQRRTAPIEGGPSPRRPTQGEEESDSEAISTPPSFVITIVGTTPVREAARKLADTFIAWLAENGEREDRPYTIIVPDDALVRCEPIRDGGTTGGRTSNTGTRATRSREATRRPGTTRRPGATDRMDLDAFAGRGEEGESEKTPWDQFAATTDIKTLIPENPLLEEARTYDNEFEIRFTVQMKPPSEVRRSARGSEDDEQAAADDTEDRS